MMRFGPVVASCVALSATTAAAEPSPSNVDITARQREAVVAQIPADLRGLPEAERAYICARMSDADITKLGRLDLALLCDRAWAGMIPNERSVGQALAGLALRYAPQAFVELPKDDAALWPLLDDAVTNLGEEQVRAALAAYRQVPRRERAEIAKVRPHIERIASEYPDLLNDYRLLWPALFEDRAFAVHTAATIWRADASLVGRFWSSEDAVAALPKDKLQAFLATLDHPSLIDLLETSSRAINRIGRYPDALDYVLATVEATALTEEALWRIHSNSPESTEKVAKWMLNSGRMPLVIAHSYLKRGLSDFDGLILAAPLSALWHQEGTFSNTLFQDVVQHAPRLLPALQAKYGREALLGIAQEMEVLCMLLRVEVCPPSRHSKRSRR